MQAITWIIERLNNVSDTFYQVYLDCFYTGFPLSIIGGFFYDLSVFFSNLAWYFYDFSLWVSDISTKVLSILDLKTINDYFWSYFIAAWNSWEWVKDAFTNVWNTVDDWWDSTKIVVYGWVSEARQFLQVQVDSISLSLNTLQISWDSFKAKIPSIDNLLTWFAGWQVAVLTTINSWWSDKLLDIRGLINTAFLEYQPFWEGWQDWRDKVAEFFTDPEEWLYDKMDEWFERFW